MNIIWRHKTANQCKLKIAEGIIKALLMISLLPTGVTAQSFITTWKTDNLTPGSSGADSIVIPLISANDPGDPITILWGDGSSTDSATAPFVHAYDSPGEYIVAISGGHHGMIFNNAGDCKKLISIEQWGEAEWTTMEGAFYGCSELLTVAPNDIPNLMADMSFRNCFREARKFNGNIGGWDVSTVNDMSYMFFNALEFNADISGWNVSNVTNMSGMFRRDTNVTTGFNKDISGWDVSNVTNMSGMFFRSLFNKDISSWNVSSVIDMSGMFAVNAFDHDIGNWDVSNVTNMSSMFQWSGDFNQDIGNWDVSNVTNMSSMFEFAVSFNQDIGSWDVSNVTNMSKMFRGDYFLTSGGLADFSTVFNRDIGDWDVSNVTNMSGMFENAVDFNQDIGGWNVSNVSDMSNMFRGKSYPETGIIPTSFNQNIQLWDVSNVSDMSGMFTFAESFNQDLSNWDVSNVNTMQSMFAGTDAFNQDIGNWNTQNVINMSRVFAGADAFNQDIGNWNTQNVINMSRMFAGADAFNQDIGNWDITNVTLMVNMLSRSGITTRNYDKILMGWATQAVQPNVTLGADSLYFCNGEAAKQDLLDQGWTIWDEGEDCSKTHFITTWVIPFNPGDPNNLEITIPTRPGYTYNYDVDWTGDGIFDDFGVTGDITHTYGGIGTKEIHIKGTFPQIYMWGSPSQKLREVNQWGSIAWESMYKAFYQCKQLYIDAKDDPDLTNLTDMQEMFRDCENMTVASTEPISRWYMGNITNISQMFYDATNFNAPLDGWYTANITNMYGMFWNAESFNQDLGNWDVSNVTNMATMFYNATDFDGDLSGWDVSSVTNMGSMFRNAASFTGYGIENWNTDTIESLSSTFNGAISFNAPIGNWDVSTLTFMSQAFRDANAFNQDLSSWDISNLSSTPFTNAMFNAFLDSGLSTENYDAMLNTWSRLPSPPSNMSPVFTPAQYCLGERAIEALTMNNGWTITDGGLAPDCPCPGYTIFKDGAWDAGMPASNTTSYIETDYDSNIHGGSFNACNLIIGPDAVLTVRPGDTLNVLTSLEVQGDVVVEPTGYISVDNE